MAFLKTMIVGSDAPGPVAAKTINPFETSQGIQTYNESQDALAQQQKFMQALSAQNGIQNQSQVFNQQQALAGQLQGVANGTGPNPALAQFNQATGQNVANQAALMAGQRGANSNVGLLARQIAQQGANTQQQAAGQSAILQSQQQLAGMQALQAQQNAMASNANSMVSNQAQGIGGYNQAALSGQQNVNNAFGAQNNANVASQNGINAANASIAASENAMGASIAGGLAQGAGAALVAMNSGGMVDGYAKGGQVNGPRSYMTHFFNKTQPVAMMKSGGPVQGRASLKGDSPVNDTVPAMLSPKEIVIPRSITMSPNAPDKAAQFVAQVLARNNLKRS